MKKKAKLVRIVLSERRTMSTAPPPSGSKKPAAAEDNNDPNNNNNNNTTRAKKQSPVLLFVGLCCIISGIFNIINAHWIHSSSGHHAAQVGKKRSIFRHHGRGGAIHHAMREFLKGKEGLARNTAQRKATQDKAEPHDEIANQQLGQSKVAVDNNAAMMWGDAEHPDRALPVAAQWLTFCRAFHGRGQRAGRQSHLC